MLLLSKTKMNKQDLEATKAYRRNGALLSMPPDEAFWMVSNRKGDFDEEGNEGDLIGIYVPPDQVDKLFTGEEPLLILKGGIVIRRNGEDRIEASIQINLDGIDDSKSGKNCNQMKNRIGVVTKNEENHG